MAQARHEIVKAFIADLARPFAIISTSGAAAWATVTIALRVDGFEAAALYIAAVYAGLAGLYGFKSWEQTKAGKNTADIAIAQTPAAPPPPGTAQITAAPDVNVTVRDATPEGELPEAERIR